MFCRRDASVSVSVRIEANAISAFVAAQVDKGGCNVANAHGVYLFIDVTGYWNVTSDLGKLFTVGSVVQSIKGTLSH